MASNVNDAAQTMINNFPEKTGKSLEEWLKLTVPSDLQKHGEIVKWLKTEHGMTHGFANMVAIETKNRREGGAASEADLVTAQYAGAKADLKPIYDALHKAMEKFGNDVEFAPKKAYVSVRRSKQFAIIQPSTKTRLDVGINLKGDAPTKRLEKSGSFNAMVSHRVRLESIDDVDQELLEWLNSAYQRA